MDAPSRPFEWSRVDFVDFVDFVELQSRVGSDARIPVLPLHPMRLVSAFSASNASGNVHGRYPFASPSNRRGERGNGTRNTVSPSRRISRMRSSWTDRPTVRRRSRRGTLRVRARQIVIDTRQRTYHFIRIDLVALALSVRWAREKISSVDGTFGISGTRLVRSATSRAAGTSVRRSQRRTPRRNRFNERDHAAV